MYVNVYLNIRDGSYSFGKPHPTAEYAKACRHGRSKRDVCIGTAKRSVIHKC